MTDVPVAMMDVLVGDCVERERDVPWMYRDNSEHGWVTTAVGKKLSSANEASRLPFRMGDRPATAVEISLDYVRVLNMEPAHIAEYYRSAKSPTLPPGYGRDLCTRDLTHTFLPGVLGLVPDLYDRPPSVARALVTIEYTSGLGGLMGFTHMLASLRAGDYKGIVERKEYHMRATDATNERLRGWFQDAANAAAPSRS